MAEYTELQLRRDSTLNWYASNPRLALGEPGVDMDLHRFKIGNGIDRWNELPYMDDDLYKLLNKQEQETADKVQELLNKIAANKLDADQKYNTITTEVRNTSRDLTGRMSAVETGQQEYQENLTERQQEYEDALTGDFEDTKAEVQAGLDEFNETRDSLTVRMNAIVGQATEETEILDARVDAEYHTHSNLGENIRNIHSEVLRVKQSGAEETTARIEADEAERSERIAAYEAERAERVAADEKHDAEIARLSDSTEKLSEREEFLREQTDANAAASLAVQEQLFREMERTRETEYSLEQETAAREQADIALNEAIQAEAQRTTDLQAETNSKNTALSEDIAAEKEAREQADIALSEWNKHSDAQNLEYGEFLQEQIDETAGEVLSTRLGLYKETEVRKQKDTEIDDELAREKEARVQAEAIQQGRYQEFLSEREERISEDARIDAELSGIDSKHTKREEELANSVQDNISSTREKVSGHAEFLQEQTDELTSLVMSEMLQSRENLRVVQEDIQLEAQERSKIDYQIRESATEELYSAREKTSKAVEHLQEQIDLTAAEVQQANISNWRKIRDLDAEDKNLHEEIVDTEQRLQAETVDVAAAIRQEIQDNVCGLGQSLTNRDKYSQEQIDELAGVVIAEAIRHRDDSRELRQKITDATVGVEGLVADEVSLREEKDEELSSGIETIVHQSSERDGYIQEQINELAFLNVSDALKNREELLKARNDKQHEDLQQQTNREHQNSQINELANSVLQMVLNIYQGFKRLKSHINLIEGALVDGGLLEESDIPPMTETEIDGMFEDIFSGNASEEEYIPVDDEDAEFIDDIDQIFNS